MDMFFFFLCGWMYYIICVRLSFYRERKLVCNAKIWKMQESKLNVMK